MKRRLVAVLLVVLGCTLPLAAEDQGPRIKEDLVYGRKDGMALTLDLIQPAKPNGAAILWIPTGGWFSPWFDAKIAAAIHKPFLDKGFTVFVIRHACAPRYNIPECTTDVRRSVRFIRMKAKEFGIDPERLGVWGGSAGGHLSLLLGTTSDAGDPKSKDPVLRHSSRVAAVVALFPPTDIRKWVEDPPDNIKPFTALKFDPKKAGDYSPLLHVKADNAAILLIHGDKDTLVPIDHSEKMYDALQKAKVKSKLVVVKGAGHSFTQKQNQTIVAPAMLDWFVTYVAEKKKVD
jgi:acetyl esterase/lipase